MKKSFGMLGLAAAMLGGLATTSSVTSNTSSGNASVEAKQGHGSTTKPASDKVAQPGTDRAIEVTVKNPYRPIFVGRASKAGMSPKQWGQHLQSTGRQKWTKGKGRKYIS